MPDPLVDSTPARAPGTVAAKRALVAALAAAGIGFGYAWLVLGEAAGFQPSADSHYHFTVAQSMLKHGPWPSPGVGLPWTLLARLPVDHYWAFHLLLVPFAAAFEYSFGLKLATACGFALILGALGAFMTRRQIAHPVALALLCVLFSNQDWRYLQLRGAQLLLPVILLMIELVAFQRASRWRHVSIVGLAWFAMLSYHGAILLWPIGVVAAGAAYLGDELLVGYRARLTAWARDAALVSLGLGLGLALNPYADRQASTFRFFVYHVLEMGGDRANLYTDQATPEFHGMPPSWLVSRPEWGLLFLATLGALLWCAAQLALRRPLTKQVRVLAALSALGIVMVSQAIRLREYAVPLGLAYLALLWGSRAAASRATRWLAVSLAVLGLYLKIPATVALVRQHLPTDMYRGARDLLVQNGQQPILNLAEADFGMLRIQYPEVVCAHALSRYFLLPNPEVFADLWYVYREPSRDEARTRETLRRFHARGVRLVATHGNRALDEWATSHPDWLQVVFRSSVSAARLYRLTAVPEH